MSTENIIHSNTPSKFPNWTPANIETLVWFDAIDKNTITASNGFVSQWDDKSGNARHISNANGAEQPTLLSNAIAFNGSTTTLYNSSPFMYGEGGNIEAYIVATGVPQIGNTMLGETSTVSDNPQYIFRTGLEPKPERISVSFRGDNNVLVQTSNISFGTMFDSTPNLAYWADTDEIYNGITGRVNGRDFSTAASPITRQTMTLTTFTVGALRKAAVSNFFLGNIHEIIVVNVTSTDVRYKMEGYLAWKWGFVGDLRDSAPYKHLPPTK